MTFFYLKIIFLLFFIHSDKHVTIINDLFSSDNFSSPRLEIPISHNALNQLVFFARSTVKKFVPFDVRYISVGIKFSLVSAISSSKI